MPVLSHGLNLTVFDWDTNRLALNKCSRTNKDIMGSRLIN